MMMPRHFAKTLMAATCAITLSGCVMIVPGPVVQTQPSRQLVARTPSAAPDPGPAPAGANCATPDAAKRAANDLLARVNATRQTKGLAPVRLAPRLRRIAQSHACDNASRNTFSHTGSDGSDLRQRLNRGHYAMRTATENVGIGFDTPEKMMAFWMASPGHRANILNPRMTEMGLGLAYGPRPNWVMVLAKPR